MLNAKILVAEDDPNSARLIKDYLSQKGAQVTCIDHGNAVLDEIKTHAYDLLILDLRLPGQNGFIVTEQLRKEHPSGGLPIIVVSAFSDRPNRLRSLQVGADYFLGKPVDLEELYLIVNNLMMRKQYLDLDARNISSDP